MSRISAWKVFGMELPVTDPDLRRRIELRAFEIWKSEGFPSGRDWAHWVQAETEILAELEASGVGEGQEPSVKIGEPS